jgi:hypothetical protein
VQDRIDRAIVDAAQPYAAPHGLDIPVAFRIAVGRRAE